MSGIHSFRPFLHVVTLVSFALCVLFPTERAGFTSLPQYHRGSGAVVVQFLHQIDEVEGHFCVFYVALCSLFFLTRVTDNALIVRKLAVTFKLKQVGSYIIKPHRDYG